MNVEFHYYSTAFLAVKAGFSEKEAGVLAYAGQFVDHHHRTLEVETPQGVVTCPPTQNFSFWDPQTVTQVLAPFHFLPAGMGAGAATSVRRDGRLSVWDVRPDSAPAKTLLVEALKSRDLMRIGLALHTYSDTWAHQNFTARNEDWNRLDPSNRLPSPGHAHAGFEPDLWLARWTDPRLVESTIVNMVRFGACARKVYRYLCTFLGKDFRRDEEAVLDELTAMILRGTGRDSVDDRVVEFILLLNLEPYDQKLWMEKALEPSDREDAHPLLAPVMSWGQKVLDRTGWSLPQRRRARGRFEDSSLGQWMRAAEEHRILAQSLIRNATGGLS